MSSRFIQGDGYPILTRYNSGNVLQETVQMPYVRDDGSKSFIRLEFAPYPASEVRIHQLASGNVNEDKKVGDILTATIRYQHIEASDLLNIFNCILAANAAGQYLKLQPRSDKAAAIYKVVYPGKISLESANMWTHSIDLVFNGSELITSLALSIP